MRLRRPKQALKKTESWAKWYKRNKILVGAATGLMISTANRQLYTDVRDLLPAAYLTLAGSVAGKMNVLTGYVCGMVTGLLFDGPYGKNPLLAAFLGGVVGAITHSLYDAQQSEENKSSK